MVFAVRLSVRASVCLSITFVYCIQMAEDIVKLHSRPHHSSFLTPNTDTQLLGNPFNGGVKYTGVERICNFRLKDMPIVDMER